MIKFENTGKETSVNCLCKTDTFAGTGINSPFKRDARLRDRKIKGVPKAGTNSRCPFYFRVAVERKSTVMENSVVLYDTFKLKIRCLLPFYTARNMINNKFVCLSMNLRSTCNDFWRLVQRRLFVFI